MSTIDERWQRLSRPVEQVREEQQRASITWAVPPPRKTARPNRPAKPRRRRQLPERLLTITQYVTADRTPDRPLVGITLSETLMREAGLVAGDRVAIGLDGNGWCWLRADPNGRWSLVASVRDMTAEQARGKPVKSRVQFTAHPPFGPAYKAGFGSSENLRVRPGEVGFPYPFATRGAGQQEPIKYGPVMSL